MSEILDRPIVLSVNAGWRPIDTRTVREAILAMNAGNPKQPPALAIDIQYHQREDGSYDFDQIEAMVPTAWEDWIHLPVRDFDEVMHSAKMRIRVPTVIMTPKYHKMPVKKFSPNKKSIYERDGGICQYTGKKLSYKEATLDHVHPQSKGGGNTFENLVLAAPDVNHKKGNKSNEEAGLKLRRKPVAPAPVPASKLIQEARHRDWKHFLEK